MKKLFTLSLLSTVVLLTGCVETSGQSYQNEQQKELLNQSISQVGMPNIVNFKEKRDAKMIWELRDDANLITHAYFQNMEGQFIYLGRCMGYGLPYTTQYTNPQTRDYNSSSGSVALPQADPNGLFSSETTNATWLMLINEETGEVEVIYSEPSIIVTQTKLPKRLVAGWSLPDNY